ncbi:IPT/TIG domain-containing protein [Glaciihabitans sp. dw_435]|uniref:IPT/TIG domain-containing protein n=1 Tax=Glaciihabitans sp. dw_435 TaxID=2720081 RepID=UPI001BD46F38|nr:IPT/TIG domain-containing protein [Glaciihabitans sp. dw_435]
MISRGVQRIGTFGLAGLVAVALVVTGGVAAEAAPVQASGTALQVALAAQAGAPLAVVADADVTVAQAVAPPSTTVAALDVAAALDGAVGITATDGTATASATAGANQNLGTSRIEDLAAEILGSPTTATVLSGTATCPATGTPVADTMVVDLDVLGQTVAATINGPAVNVSAATTVAGVVDAQVNAAVLTNIRTTTATTATATALRITLTLTGTVAGLPIEVPLGTITAGAATCVRPAAADAPTITGLTPPTGPTTGGTTVTITGTGFIPGATTVTIDGTTIPANNVTVTSPTTLTFTTPAHTAGRVAVVVSTNGQASDALTFTYLSVADTLASTGVDVHGWLAFGLFLLLAGALVVVETARRRRQP